MSDLYLEHHGVKGQKWGVRRYQNKDGTRTEEGKKRRNEEKSRADISKIVLTGALAATVIGGGVYAATHPMAVQAVVDKVRNVRIPRMDLSSDSDTAKKAAEAVFRQRDAERAIDGYLLRTGTDTVPERLHRKAEAAAKAAEVALAKKDSTAAFVAKNKDAILQDPKKVKQYADFLSSDEIKNAAEKLANYNKIDAGFMDTARKGAKWMGVVLAYGKTASEVYELKNRQLVRDASRALVEEKKQ